MKRTKASQSGVKKRGYLLKGSMLIIFALAVIFLSLNYGGKTDAVGTATATFGLEIDGATIGYFTECTGIGSKNDIVEHKIMDGITEVVRKIPGRLIWNDIVLKRAITNDQALWEWRKQVEDGDIINARKNISIVLYDQTMTPVAEWSLINGWLSSINTTVDASGILLEEVVLVSEGETRVN